MKKFIAIIAILSVIAFGFSGCGSHKRPRVEVAVINSATVPSSPVVITVELPTVYDQTQLLNDILAELREFNQQEPTADVTNITIEVDNDITIDNSVTVDMSRRVLVVHPGRQRRCPRLQSHLRRMAD